MKITPQHTLEHQLDVHIPKSAQFSCFENNAIIDVLNSCVFTFLKLVQHELPSLKCTEDKCLADFVLRKNARLNNPGAYYLEFQSVMQIMTEYMLYWDIKSKSSAGKGILGTVRAFAGADEEQGRKTLHRHWQIWAEDINQSLRNAFFDKDSNTRNKA